MGDGEEKKTYGRETAKEKSRARVQTWRQGPCVCTAQDTQGRVRLPSVFWPSQRGTNSMRHGSPPPRSSTPLCCCPAFILQSVACRLDEVGGGKGRGNKEEGQEDKMAWEGLSPNQSICFLVCPPGWLLAPARLLHSTQPWRTADTNAQAHTQQTALLQQRTPGRRRWCVSCLFQHIETYIYTSEDNLLTFPIRQQPRHQRGALWKFYTKKNGTKRHGKVLKQKLDHTCYCYAHFK